MANEHPLTARISDQLREYIQRVSQLPVQELEAELSAQIARLQARDRNQSPVTR